MRSILQFIRTKKECSFNLFLEVSQIKNIITIIIQIEKKTLGFRNLQEKLEKDEYLCKMALNPRTRGIFLHKFFTGKKGNYFQEQVAPS